MAEHLRWLPTVQGWLGVRQMNSFFFYFKWSLVFVLVWLLVYSRDVTVSCVLLGGEAPTVPVCCHSLGKGHGAVAREGGELPCPRSGSGCLSLHVSPGPVGKHRVLQCPAETAAGAAGRLQGLTSRVVQTRCFPLFPFPITRELLLLHSHGTGQHWVFPWSCCCDSSSHPL